MYRRMATSVSVDYRKLNVATVPDTYPLILWRTDLIAWGMLMSSVRYMRTADIGKFQWPEKNRTTRLSRHTWGSTGTNA